MNKNELKAIATSVLQIYICATVTRMVNNIAFHAFRQNLIWFKLGKGSKLLD